MLRLLRLQYRRLDVRVAAVRDPGSLTSAFAASFAGDLAALDRLPVETGGTEFQRAVWQATRGVPTGRTITSRTHDVLVCRPAAGRGSGTMQCRGRGCMGVGGLGVAG